MEKPGRPVNLAHPKPEIAALTPISAPEDPRRRIQAESPTKFTATSRRTLAWYGGYGTIR